MAAAILLSAFFTIGTAGPTVDGREISADHLIEMAESYDPAEYTALINTEHFIGLSAYGDFPSLGKVVALRSDTDEKGRTILQAQVEPTQALLNINIRGQKLFPSMEIQPNFAQTGKAYLTGLAMTDIPASIGTQAIQYSARNGGPVPERMKTHLYSQAFETEPFAMAGDNTHAKTGDDTKTNVTDGKDDKGEETQTFAQKFAALFAPKEEKADTNFTQLQDATLKLAEEFTSLKEAQTDEVAKLNAKIATLETDLADLKTKFSKTPAPNQEREETIGDETQLAQF